MESEYRARDTIYRKVLRDNIIGYSDDYRLSGWAFAYYLNSAHLRLRILCSDDEDGLPGFKQALGTDLYKQMAQTLSRTHVDEPNTVIDRSTFELWQIHCDALEIAVSVYAAALNQLPE